MKEMLWPAVLYGLTLLPGCPAAQRESAPDHRTPPARKVSAPTDRTTQVLAAADLAEIRADDGSSGAVFKNRAAIATAFADGTVTVAADPDSSFRRVGLRFETAVENPGLEYQVEQARRWSVWRTVPLTFAEPPLFNGSIELQRPATRVAVRASTPSEMTFLAVELMRVSPRR